MALAWGLGWQANPTIPSAQAEVQRPAFCANLNQSCCLWEWGTVHCTEPLLTPSPGQILGASLPWARWESNNSMQISSAPAHQQDVLA